MQLKAAVCLFIFAVGVAAMAQATKVYDFNAKKPMPLRMGDKLVVNLDGKDVRMTVWNPVPGGHPGMKALTLKVLKPSPGQVRFVYTFQAIKPGAAAITFKFSRIMSRGKPLDMKTVNVNVRA